MIPAPYAGASYTSGDLPDEDLGDLYSPQAGDAVRLEGLVVYARAHHDVHPGLLRGFDQAGRVPPQAHRSEIDQA